MQNVTKSTYIFWQVFLSEAKRFLHYPIEIFFLFIGRVFVILAIAVFWGTVGEFSDIPISTKDIIMYYLIAGGLIQLMWSDGTTGSDISKRVKAGEINADMTRPVGLFMMQAARHRGGVIGREVLALGLVTVGITVNLGNINLIGFILMLVAGMFASISFNMFLGALAFRFVEIRGLKNSILHLSRLLVGWLIPISLMPATFQSILDFTPFPYMLYYPVSLIQGAEISATDLITAYFVCISSYLAAKWFWNSSLKKYEAIGL